jgi:histidinol-phosphate/aromatic aminotransferase/cobyric acid decarboxylase-like protein
VARALGCQPADLLDLSATLNPFAPAVAELAQAHLDSLSRYPDVEAATEALAEVMGHPAELTVITNGGAEAIALLARYLKRGEVAEPEFSLYRRHLPSLVPGSGRWASNPNNPLGGLLAENETALVLDEAFYPVTTGDWTRGDARSGRYVVGSLTKLFACPGLRIGYSLLPDLESADAIRADQPAWAVGSLAIAVLEKLLLQADIAGWAAKWADLRREMARLLRHYDLEVLAPGGQDGPAAPWLLVASPDDLRSRLAHQRVLVRDCTSFGLPGIFRLAVPGPDGLARLERALDRASSTSQPRFDPGSPSGRSRGGSA